MVVTTRRGPTPAEEVANNQAAVNTLVGTGQLGSGNGTSLLAKLDAAANALASGNPTAAKHELEALIRKPIKDLVEELDPRMFWQIHRSTLVNVNAIAGVARDEAGRKFVLIRDRPERLEVSRAYLHLFKQM